MNLDVHHILSVYLPSLSIIFATVASLLVCYQDIMTYRISNRVVIAIAVSAFGVWLPLLDPTAIMIQVGIGALFLVIGFLVFHFKIMGAGDGKLFAALGFWCQPQNIMMFLMVMAIAGFLVSVVYTGIRYKKVMALKENSNLTDMLYLKIPYGLALSAGGFFLFVKVWTQFFSS
ncbi:MAG: prepilin peptidase [bacterium]|jgi:prepilin peptidase CpaA